jgi:hypothetical protein
MRSALQRYQVTHAQTVDEDVNAVSAGTDEVEADDSRADMLASLEVVLHWLGSAVAVAFIGLAIIEPERVERTLTSLMFKARNIQIANVAWSAVEMAKSDDRIKQIDAEHTFEVIDFPPQVFDEVDRGSQSQTDITGSAPIPTSSAAESIGIDQSLAIEFPTAAYESHKSADAIKRHPVQRAKVAAKRSVSNNRQANSEANSNNPKPLEPRLPNSAY